VWRTTLLPSGRHARDRLAAAIGAVTDARRRHAALARTSEPARTEVREATTGPVQITSVARDVSDVKTDGPVAEPAVAPTAAEKQEEGGVGEDEPAAPVAVASKPKTKRKKKAKHDSIGA